MNLFESSPNLLIAFTNLLFHSLWIGAIIYLIFRVALHIIHDRYSSIRYWISVGGLFLFVSSFIALFFRLYAPPSPVSSTLAIPSINKLLILESLKGISADEGIGIQSYYPLIIRLYLAGIVVLTFRWILSAFRINRIIQKSSDAEGAAKQALERLRRSLGIKTKVRLLISKRITVPSVYGFIKPVIIVPAGMFFNLPLQQVESILMHELIHIKRFDFLVNLIQTFVELLFFFNPFAWAISGIIRDEREKNCDDKVIHAGSSPAIYAKALFNLSLLENSHPGLAISATGTRHQMLLKRIQRLLNINTMKTKHRQRAVLTYLVIVSILVIIITSSFSSALFTIDKGGNNNASAVELNTVEVNSSSLSADPTENSRIYVHSSIDTGDVSDLESMTEEEWNKYKQNLEKDYQELKSIDWEKEEAEFEKQKQQMLTELHEDQFLTQEKLQAEMEKIRQEMKSIDKEKLMLDMERARAAADTALENIDMEYLHQQMEVARQEMELAMKEMHYKMQDSTNCLHEAHEALHESLHEIEEIDLKEIMENVEMALEDLDMDFDFDFDHEININLDSIMKNAQIAIESIDFKEIRNNIEESMLEMEKELQELEKKREDKKNTK